jgi:Amt family ammonium transporter
MVIGRRQGIIHWKDHLRSLDKRENNGNEAKPSNIPYVILGAALLWFGWFGFNAGSALSANGIAANAFVVTHMASSAAAITWVIMEGLHRGKPTTLGAASGAVAGLVAITPASGFVGPISSLIIGGFSGIICYGGIMLKSKLRYDDSLDVVGIHGQILQQGDCSTDQESGHSLLSMTF